MKLEDVERKLEDLRFKRKQFAAQGIFTQLVEAITEYTLVEPPRCWYLLEIPEPSPSSTGGWRKIVEIMKRRGYEPPSQGDEEILVNSLAEAYTFSGSTKFRKIITALMIKVSREAGLLHYWHRILFVTAKQLLDEDMSEDFDPLWAERLELDPSFIELSIPPPTTAAQQEMIESLDGMETLLEYPILEESIHAHHHHHHHHGGKHPGRGGGGRGIKRRRKTTTTTGKGSKFLQQHPPHHHDGVVQTMIETGVVVSSSDLLPMDLPPQLPLPQMPMLHPAPSICKFEQYEEEEICTATPIEDMDMIDSSLITGVIFI